MNLLAVGLLLMKVCVLLHLHVFRLCALPMGVAPEQMSEESVMCSGVCLRLVDLAFCAFFLADSCGWSIEFFTTRSGRASGAAEWFHPDGATPLSRI